MPKVLRDNIAGITIPAIQRLCRSAGAFRISAVCYDEIRRIIKTDLEQLISKSVVLAQTSKRNTLMEKDVRGAAQSNGIDLAFGINQKVSATKGAKSCGKRPRTSNAIKKKKAGTVIRSDIRYQQKHSDCFVFPRESFKRLIKEIIQHYSDDMRLAERAAILIQGAIEARLVGIVQNAVLAQVHAGRQTLMDSDLFAAIRMKGDRVN